MSTSFSLPRTALWNKGNDAINTFFQASRWHDTREFTHLRSTVLELDQNTSGTNNLEVQLAIQTSDDRETVGSPVVIDSSQTANADEKLNGGTWTDLSTTLNAKRYFRTGFVTTNKTSTTTIDFAYASGLVEAR